MELLGHEDIEMTAVAAGEEALQAMLDKPFDCVVLDLRLPDMSGFELLEQMHAEPALTQRAGGRLHRQRTQRRGADCASRQWPRALS